MFQRWCQAGYSPSDFWHQTPRSTLLAIWGARQRLEADFRNIVTGAWLGGMLSQCPPAQYPPLEKLIGDQGDSPAPSPQVMDPKEAAANARVWGLLLSAGKRRKARKGEP